MKCPRCNSTNLIRSHRRGSEVMLRFVSPREPYRCKDCNERFWKFINPLKNLAFLVFALILLVVVVIPISWILLLAPKIHDNNAPVTRIDRNLAAANPERQPVKHPISPPPELVTTTIPETPPFQTTSGVETPPISGSPLNTEHIGTSSSPAAGGNAAEPSPPASPPLQVQATESPLRSPAPPEAEETATVTPPPAPVEESAPPPQMQAPTPATESTDATTAPLTDFRLRRIRTEQTPDAFRILVDGGGRIPEYRTLFLDQSPPKWVVDLPGEWQYNGPLKIEPPAGPVQLIRLGRHPDKLRIVLDLTVRNKPRLDLAQTQTGLAMTLETL